MKLRSKKYNNIYIYIYIELYIQILQNNLNFLFEVRIKKLNTITFVNKFNNDACRYWYKTDIRLLI